jgi:transcriptional regulator with XRE-family HTH domain
VSGHPFRPAAPIPARIGEGGAQAMRRMARAALGLGVRELAAAAKVSIDTVARFERGDELKERTIDALQRALEAAGVEFTNGDQPGVRLTRAAAARSAEAAEASKPSAAAKVVRGQSANAPKKKR